MNVVIVDTSSWISYLSGKSNADIDLALKEGRAFLPPLVVAELLSARLNGADRQALVSLLKELPLCDGSFEHWVKVGELRSRLASKGVSISTADAHVAQCCMDLEGYLLTEDSIFEKVSRVSPLKVL